MNNKEEAIMVNVDGKPQIAFYRGNGVFETEMGQKFRLPNKEENILRVFQNRERRMSRLDMATTELSISNGTPVLHDYQESPEEGLISDYMLPDHNNEIEELLAEFSHQKGQRTAFEEGLEATDTSELIDDSVKENLLSQMSKENSKETGVQPSAETKKETKNEDAKSQEEPEQEDAPTKADSKKIAKAEKRLSKEMKKADKKKAKENRRRKNKADQPATNIAEISDESVVADVLEKPAIEEGPVENKKESTKKNGVWTALIIVLLVLALIFVTGLFLGQSATIGLGSSHTNTPAPAVSSDVESDSTPTATPEPIVPHISLTIDASPDAEVNGEVGVTQTPNSELDTNSDSDVKEGQTNQTSERGQKIEEGDNS